MKKIAIINGPNLNFVGIREKNVYGTLSFLEMNKTIEQHALKFDISPVFFQSNSEGGIIDFLQFSHTENFSGIVGNFGAFTHYSYAIYDAIKSISIPVIEVHMSNTSAREEFRHKSVISAACIGTIAGFGIDSYLLAINYFANTKDSFEH